MLELYESLFKEWAVEEETKEDGHRDTRKMRIEYFNSFSVSASAQMTPHNLSQHSTLKQPFPIKQYLPLLIWT